MTNCYYYDEYTLGSVGSLDSVVDCTYVLIMTNSSRKEQIKQQLQYAGLTSNIIFQYNRGYKTCDKQLKHNKPNYDLCHANQTAFKHALNRGYNRILLLEDDCEFDSRIQDPKILSDINHFQQRPGYLQLRTLSYVQLHLLISFWEKIIADYCCPLQRMPLFITKNI